MVKKIIFEIRDENTLILKTSLAGSLQDQIFSTNETTGSSSESQFSYSSYYNISQSGSKVSRLELRSDGSFAFIDQNDLDTTEINGTFAVEQKMLKMKGRANVKEYNFNFSIGSEGNLILQDDIGISATGDVFSTVYNPSVKIPCTGLTSLYNSYWSMEGSSSWNLEAKPTPADTTDVITYYSEDENVVKVDDKGNMYPQKAGKTKIHIRCGSQERVVEFETRAKGPSSIEFDENPFYIYLNNTGKIPAKALPATADQTLTYESSDKSIATVDSNGNVTGVSPGNVNITVKAVNGVSAVLKVCVEGETVIFNMENNVTVKASSGALIPYKAYLIVCWDGDVNRQDVTNEVEFHTAYTSALTIQAPGYICASGAIYESVDIPVYFTFSDGSSLYVTSDTYTVRVLK